MTWWLRWGHYADAGSGNNRPADPTAPVAGREPEGQPRAAHRRGHQARLGLPDTLAGVIQADGARAKFAHGLELLLQFDEELHNPTLACGAPDDERSAV